MGLRDFSYDCLAAETILLFHLIEGALAVMGALIIFILKRLGGDIMKRKIILSLVLLMLMSSVPVFAHADTPVIYKDTITVTNDGGSYHIGFINLIFKKDSFGADVDQVTLNVEIYAENGVGYIEVTPDIVLEHPAYICVHDYDGLLYDKAVGKNIHVSVERQFILAPHFSRYVFWG